MDYPAVPLPDAPLSIEPGFEPQSRARSNTWPLPRPEDSCFNQSSQPPLPENNELTTSGVLGFQAKKSTSRRNAWGNLSYADLITQAIQSSPDNRLTLSQIYDWMVTNVSYFKDKGDSNSSAGWKNSIRHNLSLHNRFMRVQNEGTGKSSWWMLNPDAKPGKAARRRATSMETSKFEKKRGRIKKKLEAMRNGILDTPSPASSLSEGLDLFPESPHVHNFNLSPSDFRPRASSNASSCGRLSPIMSEAVDLHDSQVPPMSPWDSYSYGHYTSPNLGVDRFGTEQLAANLGNTMKLHESVGSFEFHQQPFRQSPNYSGGATVAQSGGFPLSTAAIPTTVRNDQVQMDSQLLNGIYKSTYTTSTGGANSFLLQQQPDIKPMIGGHQSHQHTVTDLNLDFSLEQLEGNPFECNVDEVLQTELNLGGEIDFNFGGPTTNLVNNQIHQNQNNGIPNTTSPSPFTTSVATHHHHPQQQPTTNGRQWVH